MYWNPDTIDNLPRLRLGKLPTLLDEMSNLSKMLGGPRLLIKRDDLRRLGYMRKTKRGSWMKESLEAVYKSWQHRQA